MARGRLRLLDAVGALVLLLYGAVVLAAQGAGGGGASLDPVLARAQARGALRVATDVGYRPFSDMQGGAPAGYDIDLARAVAARLGLAVEFVPTGYDALYDALTSGRADMVASALPYAPELGYRARFSRVYFDAGLLLLAPAASPIAGAGDLAGRRVGAVLGSDGDAYARRLAQTTALELRTLYDTPAEVAADLRAGRLDGAILDGVAGLTAASGGDLRVVEALSSEPYVLAMPPEAFQLQIEVDRALDALRAEGFFDQLNARWLR